MAANQARDHSTIARFRERHEAALAGLFGDVLELCAEAGLGGRALRVRATVLATEAGGELYRKRQE